MDAVLDVLFIGWDIYNLFANDGYKDWKNWTALGVDVAFAVIPFVTCGGGQIISIGDKVDDADNVVDLVKGIDNFGDMNKVTFIGRNMDRVTDVATAVGKADDLYQVWKGYDKSAKGVKLFFHNMASAFHDGSWLLGKLRGGFNIIDIGMKSSHISRGLWYGTEMIVLGFWKYRNIWKWYYHLM